MSAVHTANEGYGGDGRTMLQMNMEGTSSFKIYLLKKTADTQEMFATQSWK